MFLKAMLGIEKKQVKPEGEEDQKDKIDKALTSILRPAQPQGIPPGAPTGMLADIKNAIGTVVQPQPSSGKRKTQGRKQDGWKRILLKRVDKVSQHYWQRKKN